jgi:hypothetical protein
MENSALLYAHSLYVECLAVGKFAKRRWNGPEIDTSVYDLNDSDLPGCPANVANGTSPCPLSIDVERTTLPKSILSGRALTTLRQWLTSLRTSKRAAH